MAIWHGKRGKTKTGAEITLSRKKKKRELGSLPVFTEIGKEKKAEHRTKGGGKKTKLFATESVNVMNPETNKVQKVKILDVIENPANPDFVRRKIITKGTIIKTEIGNARVTSRPSQHGIVNAIALEKEKS